MRRQGTRTSACVSTVWQPGRTRSSAGLAPDVTSRLSRDRPCPPVGRARRGEGDLPQPPTLLYGDAWAVSRPQGWPQRDDERVDSVDGGALCARRPIWGERSPSVSACSAAAGALPPGIVDARVGSRPRARRLVRAADERHHGDRRPHHPPRCGGRRRGSSSAPPGVTATLVPYFYEPPPPANRPPRANEVGGVTGTAPEDGRSPRIPSGPEALAGDGAPCRGHLPFFGAGRRSDGIARGPR